MRPRPTQGCRADDDDDDDYSVRCKRHRKRKTSQLMLYSEIIAVCSQIHTKHINTLCGQNEEIVNPKLVGI
jgi:hypothetical protein